MIDVARSADTEMLNALARHPRVKSIEVSDCEYLSFQQGEWHRSVVVGDANIYPRGLIELMDNNPIVCADTVSVPSPAATLALIALGPLASAGVLFEVPTIILSIPAEEQDVARFLSTEGWDEGALIHSELTDLEGVAAATVMAAIQTPADLDEIDSVFEERFGRSFYIRRDETSEWDPILVRGKPYAVYRLRIAAEYPVSLLTIRVLADLRGKLGVSQIIHAMNIMAGFEESLGIKEF